MTEEFYGVDFITGEGADTDVSSYWDSVSGSIERTATTDLEGEHAFSISFSEESYGVINSPASASDNVILETKIDPNSQTFYNEYWLLDSGRLDANTYLE